MLYSLQNPYDTACASVSEWTKRVNDTLETMTPGSSVPQGALFPSIMLSEFGRPNVELVYLTGMSPTLIEVPQADDPNGGKMVVDATAVLLANGVYEAINAIASNDLAVMHSVPYNDAFMLRAATLDDITANASGLLGAVSNEWLVTQAYAVTSTGGGSWKLKGINDYKPPAGKNVIKGWKFDLPSVSAPLVIAGGAGLVSMAAGFGNTSPEHAEDSAKEHHEDR